MIIFGGRKLLDLAAASALLLAPHVAFAADYPTHPVRLVVGYPAGSGPDIQARIIGDGLASRIGQPVIVDNRPGGASNIATAAVARAAPDGYTLLYATTAN